MKKTILWATIIVLVSIGVWMGYASDVQDGVVRIGILTPLTGSFASLGEDFSIGARIFAQENSNVILFEEDTKSDPKVAVSAMNKLIAEGVTIFIGGPSSSVNLALAPVAEQNRVILLTQSKTPKIDIAGEYVFRAFPLVNREVEMMADFISTRSIKNVAVIFDSSSDTTLIAKDIFEKEFTAAGGTIVASEGFDSKTVKDFRTLVLKTKSAAPDAIYLATTEPPSGPLIKQLRELGVNAQLFGWSVHDTSRLIAPSGGSIEGLIFTAEPFVCNRDKLTVRYCASYAEIAGSTTPQYYGAYGYDVLKMLASIAEINKGDIEKIKGSISNIQNIKGVVGIISIDEKGDVQKNDFIFKTFKNGKIVELEF